MKKKDRRIAITGYGVVSCFGSDPEIFFEKLLAGESGVKTISEFPTDQFPTKFAASIEDFDPGSYIDKRQARRIDKSIAYAQVAGKKALELAGIDPIHMNEEEKNRAGILIGSGMGGMGIFVDGVQTLIEKGPKRVTPFFVPYIISNMSGAMLAIDLGFKGPNYSISTACATGNHSILSAASHIWKGDADIMIAGGTEAPLLPIGLAGFCSIRALSERNEDPKSASRPWDKGRDGFVMGEGAGVLVLESYEHAEKRGATIYAELLGGAMNCDAHHITEPDGERIADCVRLALEDAGVSPEKINYINAHATSTPVGDMCEINALKTIFKHRNKIAVNATKSMIGHSLGAAGGIEAVVTVMSMIKKKIHPTINLEDPEEGLDFKVPTKQMDFAIDTALSNSFGFGGHNACLIFQAK